MPKGNPSGYKTKAQKQHDKESAVSKVNKSSFVKKAAKKVKKGKK